MNEKTPENITKVFKETIGHIPTVGAESAHNTISVNCADEDVLITSIISLIPCMKSQNIPVKAGYFQKTFWQPHGAGDQWNLISKGTSPTFDGACQQAAKAASQYLSDEK